MLSEGMNNNALGMVFDTRVGHEEEHNAPAEEEDGETISPDSAAAYVVSSITPPLVAAAAASRPPLFSASAVEFEFKQAEEAWERERDERMAHFRQFDPPNLSLALQQIEDEARARGEEARRIADGTL